MTLNRREFTRALGAALASAAASRAALGDPAEPPRFDRSDPQRYGAGIAEHADRIDSGWVDQYSECDMTLLDGRGDRAERRVNLRVLEGAQGDKTLIRFMDPAEVRGVAVLIHEHIGGNDESWLYLPATRRVRRISGANRSASFQGTEFSYEDLGTFSARRYAWRFIGEGALGAEPVYELEARPSYRDTGYSKLTFRVHARLFRIEQIEFFDPAGRKLKTLTASRWQHVHERFFRPGQLEMKSHQTGKMTTLETKALLVNLGLYKKKDGSPRANLSSDQFTRVALENG